MEKGATHEPVSCLQGFGHLRWRLGEGVAPTTGRLRQTASAKTVWLDNLRGVSAEISGPKTTEEVFASSATLDKVELAPQPPASPLRARAQVSVNAPPLFPRRFEYKKCKISKFLHQWWPALKPTSVYTKGRPLPLLISQLTFEFWSYLTKIEPSDLMDIMIKCSNA